MLQFPLPVKSYLCVQTDFFFCSHNSAVFSGHAIGHHWTTY